MKNSRVGRKTPNKQTSLSKEKIANTLKSCRANVGPKRYLKCTRLGDCKPNVIANIIQCWAKSKYVLVHGCVNVGQKSLPTLNNGRCIELTHCLNIGPLCTYTSDQQQNATLVQQFGLSWPYVGPTHEC